MVVRERDTAPQCCGRARSCEIRAFRAQQSPLILSRRAFRSTRGHRFRSREHGFLTTLGLALLGGYPLGVDLLAAVSSEPSAAASPGSG